MNLTITPINDAATVVERFFGPLLEQGTST